MSWYRAQLEDWLSKLDVSANLVYDIGGEQGEVKRRVKSWNVKNYKVLDLPDYNLEEKQITLFEPADIIFCLEVFEYLINPLQAMENIAILLKKGGKAYVTFQFVYPRHNELEVDSLRYTETAVRRLALASGLTITNINYRTDASGYLEAFYAKDGMRAAKGITHNVTGYIVEVTK